MQVLTRFRLSKADRDYIQKNKALWRSEGDVIAYLARLYASAIDTPHERIGRSHREPAEVWYRIERSTLFAIDNLRGRSVELTRSGVIRNAIATARAWETREELEKLDIDTLNNEKEWSGEWDVWDEITTEIV